MYILLVLYSPLETMAPSFTPPKILYIGAAEGFLSRNSTIFLKPNSL